MATISRHADEPAQSRMLDALRLMSTPWALVPILLAAFVVYAPTLADWFVGDDFWFLRASQQHGIGSEIVRSFDYRNVGSSIEFDRYRPLYPIAWRLQYAAFGLHAFPYHAIVLGLHLACVATVWCIARRLFRESWAVNLVALIFALHPAYMDAVAAVAAGNRVFAALPYLLALLCYMRSLESGERRAGAWQAGAFVMFVVAVGFHSASLTLAAVLVGYRFLVAGAPRDAWRPRAWLPFVPFAVVVVASAAVQAHVRGQIPHGNEGFVFGFHQYEKYGYYLGAASQPVTPESFTGVLHAALSDARGLGSLALVIAAVAMLMRARDQRLATFVVGWAAVVFLPDSTLVLQPSGRLFYMPGPAIALLLVAIFVWLRDELPPDRATAVARAFPYMLALLVPIVMFVTWGRTRDVSHEASRAQAFVERVRSEFKTMPTGTLYVSPVPSGLITFDQSSRLEAAVELYYGDARVVYVRPGQVAAVKAALKPDDQFYDDKP